MARPPVANKARRVRGSLTRENIIDGAIELAQNVSVEGVNVALLARRLGVTVTGICWHFRKKDDLLAAMARRVLDNSALPPLRVTADQWRASLSLYAHAARKTFLNDPLLTDLLLMRGDAYATPAVGDGEFDNAVAALQGAGLSHEHAVQALSAVVLHVRAAVVLERLTQLTTAARPNANTEIPSAPAQSESRLLDADPIRAFRHLAVSDERTFEYGLQCILNRAEHLISDRVSSAGPAAIGLSPRKLVETRSDRPTRMAAERRLYKR